MRDKRRRSLAAGVVLSGAVVAAFAGSAPAARDTPSARQAQDGVNGTFSAVMMVHTSSGGFGTLPGVNPWSGQRTAGTMFRYRSIACSGNAPVNNISSDLPSYNTRVLNSRAPSSMRAHPFEFSVKRNKQTRRWEMLGNIAFTVCQLRPGATALDDPVPDETKPRIRVTFRANFARMTTESLRFAGKFRLRGGTQRYEDLRGSGRIAGYLMCFAPEGCAANGSRYLDGQFVMHGSYRDPTPQLAAG